MDKDGYPIQEELDTIKNWDLTKKKVTDLLEYIGEIWWNADWGFKLTGKRMLKFELHTGGWSGNEDIIEALQSNRIFWLLYWEKSHRGGHYYFKIKAIAKGGER